VTIHLRDKLNDPAAYCGVRARTTNGKAQVCPRCLRVFKARKSATLPVEATGSDDEPRGGDTE
jgi:hypothetical protein